MITREMKAAALKAFKEVLIAGGLAEAAIEAALLAADALSLGEMATKVIHIPPTVSEAETMERMGFAWLRQHAPERLTQEGLARPIPVPAPVLQPVAEKEWPVGEAEVVIYDPRADIIPNREPHKIIDASIGFMRNAEVGERLYTKAQVEEILRSRGTETFPQPRRNNGEEPCGECHLHPGERCDICGAIATPAGRS